MTEIFQQAVLCHQAGQHEQAASLYRQVLRDTPEHADANHNLGLLELDSHHEEEGLRYLLIALETNPVERQYWLSYINALITTGQIDNAREVMSLGRQHGLAGADVDAMEKRIFPLSAEQYQSQSDELLREYNIGNFSKAEQLAQELISSNPEDAFAWKMLGTLFTRQSRYPEAEYVFETLTRIFPEDYTSFYNLGNTLQRQGKAAPAATNYARVIELQPEFAEAYNNFANVLVDLGRTEEAIAAYRKAVVLKPDYAQAYCNLGLILSDYGQVEEAIDCYRKALSIVPDYQDAYDNLLFCINYLPDLDADAAYAEYREFNTRFGDVFKTDIRPWPNQKSINRRLKVGYVSPAFKMHSCRHFLEPLLVNHDRSEIEVYAYAELEYADQLTMRYQQYADHWVPTRGMSDEAMAERIRVDEIDILVDVAGHTGHNRLQVFARKPAPVSLHWLDFGYTTGLTAIDYYLTDQFTIPEGSEHLFSEKPWRMPGTAYAYRPAEGMGEVSALPAKARGYITFGTLTRAVRINHHVIRTWSAILKQTPNARLVINSGNYQNPVLKQQLLDRFVAQGIAADRLDIGSNSPPWDVLRGIDIGLDCFPHNSGTTLFETLYMGIPFITLASRPSVGRLGASVLHGLGHPEWIADTEEGYIAKAVQLAHNLEELDNLRNGLRQTMEQSLLMDEKGFARTVEAAYRQMWQIWCEQ